MPDPCPTVNLFKANKYQLRNLPKPTLLPIHGYPEDQDFYGDKFKQRYTYDGPSYHTTYEVGCGCFMCDPPFGRLWGFKTAMGVVQIPAAPVHGYVWDHKDGEWVLAASKP